MKQFNQKRVQLNLQALAELKKEHPDRNILKLYSGWGGLREAIFTPDVYRELKKHLSNQAIDSMKKTLTNAYFTPKPLVRFIYGALAKLGKSFKQVLEPSVGHGLFFELMPEHMKKVAKLYAVEIEEVSCRIINNLYPQTHLYQGGFETYQQEAGFFDLIIGNPPYGREGLQDAHHPDLSHLRIHHYFVAKCMRLLAPGGILAMVLPKYFLDNKKDHVRDIIHQEGGSLLAAYRLPDNLFDDAKVTVDIVFLVKEKGSSSWLNLDKLVIDGKSFSMNRYFTENPSHILGELAAIEAYERPELTCREYPEKDTIKRLSQHLPGFPPTEVPSLDAYKQRLATQMKAVEAQLSSLAALREKLWQAQQAVQWKEREFVLQQIQAIPFVNLNKPY